MIRERPEIVASRDASATALQPFLAAASARGWRVSQRRQLPGSPSLPRHPVKSRPLALPLRVVELHPPVRQRVCRDQYPACPADVHARLDHYRRVDRAGDDEAEAVRGRAKAIGITCHGDPVALKTALERHDFDCTQMALNAGLASMTDSMQIAPIGAASFEHLALPVARRKRMGVIAMKVFGQEHLVGAAAPDRLLAYALSLPVSVCSVGMPRTEFIERNAAFARTFKPISRRERRRLMDSIEAHRTHAMVNFLQEHCDA